MTPARSSALDRRRASNEISGAAADGLRWRGGSRPGNARHASYSAPSARTRQSERYGPDSHPHEVIRSVRRQEALERMGEEIPVVLGGISMSTMAAQACPSRGTLHSICVAAKRSRNSKHINGYARTALKLHRGGCYMWRRATQMPSRPRRGRPHPCVSSCAMCHHILFSWRIPWC